MDAPAPQGTEGVDRLGAFDLARRSTDLVQQEAQRFRRLDRGLVVVMAAEVDLDLAVGEVRAQQMSGADSEGCLTDARHAIQREKCYAASARLDIGPDGGQQSGEVGLAAHEAAGVAVEGVRRRRRLASGPLAG